MDLLDFGYVHPYLLTNPLPNFWEAKIQVSIKLYVQSKLSNKMFSCLTTLNKSPIIYNVYSNIFPYMWRYIFKNIFIYPVHDWESIKLGTQWEETGNEKSFLNPINSI